MPSRRQASKAANCKLALVFFPEDNQTGIVSTKNILLEENETLEIEKEVLVNWEGNMSNGLVLFLHGKLFLLI